MKKQMQLRNAYYRAMNFAVPFDGEIKDAIIRMRMRDYNMRGKTGFSDSEIDSAICAGDQEVAQCCIISFK